MKLERTDLLQHFRDFVRTADGIIIGAPGAGKTFMLAYYCDELLRFNAACLYLPIDKLGVNSDSELRAELGISTDLPTYLKSQEKQSVHPPVLIIDAFDAARSELAQHFVLNLITQVKKGCPHWRIVVSARSYDAKKSSALQNLFPEVKQDDSSPVPEDPDIRCRHIVVPLLSTEEVETVVRSVPGLPPVYENGTHEFKRLLHNPFNLRLVELLVSDALILPRLSQINSAIQLLNLFWNRRVEQSPKGTDLRVLLTRVTRQMVTLRTLAVRVDDVYPLGASDLWDSALSSEILALVLPGKKRVSFAHNILFDYAVSILLIEDEPGAACNFLSEDLSRPLFLRPSLDYYFTRLWHGAPDTFWDVFWYMLSAPEIHVRVYAMLVPSTVMAREARTIEEFRPLLRRLRAEEKIATEAALRLLQTVRGLFSGRRDSPWAELLTEISSFLKTEFAWELGALTFELLERTTDFANQNISFCAHIGQRLLEWVWLEREKASTAYLDNVGALWGVRLVARTYASAPGPSRELLKPILQRLSDPKFPIDYFSRLTDSVPFIWRADEDFAIAVYEAAFSHQETSEEKTSFGSPVMPLTSTRRQDFSMCQFYLTRHYSQFLNTAPMAAARAAFRALNQYLTNEHIVPFLNPGFSVKDLSQKVRFRGRTAIYIQDGSYIWAAAGSHPDVSCLS